MGWVWEEGAVFDRELGSDRIGLDPTLIALRYLRYGYAFYTALRPCSLAKWLLKWIAGILAIGCYQGQLCCLVVW